MTERHSQQMRRLGPEIDPLRLAVGWTWEDMEKPHILIETVGGDSHPSSSHLPRLATVVRDGAIESGGVVGRYDCTDLCDGILQGTPAMAYSLPSREIIAAATEMHARGGHFDGLVALSGGDKAIPGHLLALARLGLPAIHVPAGGMDPGPWGDSLPHGTMSLEQVGTIHAQLRRGQIDPQEYHFLCENACPSRGTCAFFGTAHTMQALSEALGLALPTSANRPAHLFAMERGCRQAGQQIIQLMRRGITTKDILTQEALENALIVHAATAGSTNALLHLAALAGEAGLRFDYAKVQQINDRVPFIANVRPSGEHAVPFFWYAGGVSRVMWELREVLHRDCLTVTGKTVGENLDELQKSGWLEQQLRFLQGYGLALRDIIRSPEDPVAAQGGIAILTGNLAPEGAVVKRSAVDPAMRHFTGRAQVFDSQERALEAIYAGRVKPGMALVVRYEGPRGSCMPEQYYVTEAIASEPTLNTGVALITDGRFSGASRGPCIGHVAPEAAQGGPIALVEDGDLIRVDLEAGRLDIVGVGGQELPSDEVGRTLAQRRQRWQPPQPKFTAGLLGLYSRLASSAAAGAAMGV